MRPLAELGRWMESGELDACRCCDRNDVPHCAWGFCRTCYSALSDHFRYQENRETVAEKKKRYYQENREALAEKRKRYREENRETLAEKRKRYREENRERAKEAARRKEWPLVIPGIGRARPIGKPYKHPQRGVVVDAEIEGTLKRLLAVRLQIKRKAA